MIDILSRYFAEGSIKRDTIRIYALQFLTLGISLVSSIIVARTLGPAKKGVVDLFHLLNSFVLDFGLLGFGSGLLYYLANRGRPVVEVHGTGVAYAVTAGSLAVILGGVGLPAWRSLFPNLPDWVILLAFVLAPVRYYTLIWSNIMMGLNKAVSSYRINMGMAAVTVLAVLALWNAQRLTVGNVIGISAGTSVLAGTIAFMTLFRMYPGMSPDGTLAKNCLKYGLVVYIGAVANVLHFKVDQMMINYWLGTKEVGIYAVSVRWAEALFILDGAIGAAALYRITASSPAESQRLSRRLFRAQLVISASSGMVLALLARPLVVTLYGEAFREAVPPLMLLIPGIVVWSSSKIVSNMLNYNRNLTGFVTTVAVAGSAANIGLNYFFLAIMKYGINGVAAASSISYGFVVTLILMKARRLPTDAPFETGN